MKLIVSLLALISLSGAAQAEQFRFNYLLNNTLPKHAEVPAKPTEKWILASPTYSEWVSKSEPYECSAWFPLPRDKPEGQSFTQSAQCKQNQERASQQRELEVSSQAYRDLGDPVMENRVVSVSKDQNAIGTTYFSGPLTVGFYSKSGYTVYGSVWSPQASIPKMGSTHTNLEGDAVYIFETTSETLTIADVHGGAGMGNGNPGTTRSWVGKFKTVTLLNSAGGVIGAYPISIAAVGAAANYNHVKAGISGVLRSNVASFTLSQ
ncbi:hypothetical protein YA0089_27260 [Pseudomonas viridiflava]|nr:hypothetical protein [Pseudomonas viridiflava]